MKNGVQISVATPEGKLIAPSPVYDEQINIYKPGLLMAGMGLTKSFQGISGNFSVISVKPYL